MTTAVSVPAAVRYLTTCPGCQGKKDPGALTCWDCFKGPGGFKYHDCPAGLAEHEQVEHWLRQRSKPPFNPSPGQGLPNGAVVVAFKAHPSEREGVVLAMPGHGAPYVTWVVGWANGSIDCYWGSYHNDILAAAEDFKSRCASRFSV